MSQMQSVILYCHNLFRDLDIREVLSELNTRSKYKYPCTCFIGHYLQQKSSIRKFVKLNNHKRLSDALIWHQKSRKHIKSNSTAIVQENLK